MEKANSMVNTSGSNKHQPSPLIINFTQEELNSTKFWNLVEPIEKQSEFVKELLV